MTRDAQLDCGCFVTMKAPVLGEKRVCWTHGTWHTIVYIPGVLIKCTECKYRRGTTPERADALANRHVTKMGHVVELHIRALFASTFLYRFEPQDMLL